MILIDAYNVIFSVQNNQKSLEALREEFLIKVCAEYPKEKVIVIFDGRSSSLKLKNPAQNVSISFSRNPQSADDLIRKMAQKYRNKPITLISKDRALIESVRSPNIQVSNLDRIFKSHDVNSAEKPQSFKDHETDLYLLGLDLKHKKP